MSIEIALRATEVLLGWAFILQSIEHLAVHDRIRWVFVLRLFASVALVFGVQTTLAIFTLFAIFLLLLHRFQGPYNGGSDRMGGLILCALTLLKVIPEGVWQDAVFGYLALQLTLSYFISGKVKLVNQDWRSGQALRDVFAFSAYPVSKKLRELAGRPLLLKMMSWAVILFEVGFPLALISQTTLFIALFIAALFHLANAFVFGLNRFFWIWCAAYPSLIWLQSRLFIVG